ncbi:MAG: peptide ABC transporter ATP-binding protein, partial [Ideonella sp.]|nr:peptide ABC transporter ATP-binding protein [Ideonella sp.]
MTAPLLEARALRKVYRLPRAQLLQAAPELVALEGLDFILPA